MCIIKNINKKKEKINFWGKNEDEMKKIEKMSSIFAFPISKLG